MIRNISTSTQTKNGHERFGIISDIDDTVIRTDATSLLGTFRSTMLANARTRLPFPGVAALYRALHGAGTNPLFYVSSSPWNIYDMLSDVLAIRGIPAGPLLLRNWGLERRLELAFRQTSIVYSVEKLPVRW